MPIYEYRFRTEGHKFELLRSMDRVTDSVECPTCGGESHRLLSLFATVVKGDGGQAEGEPAMGGGCCGGACGCSTSLN